MFFSHLKVLTLNVEIHSLYQIHNKLSTTAPGKDSIDELSEMHTLYTTLSEDLLHPLFQTVDHKDLKENISKMEEYRSANPEHRVRKGMLSKLEKVKNWTDRLTKQYEIICRLRVEGLKSPNLERPSPNTTRGKWRWRYGSMGKPQRDQPERQLYKTKVVFPGGEGSIAARRINAVECHWWTPETELKLSEKLLSLGRPSETIYFKQEFETSYYGRRGPPPKPTPPSPYGMIIERGPTKHVIVGWTLSCEWNGKKAPAITVISKDNGIFGDELSVEVDSSVSWHCKVTLIEESDYNFPIMAGDE